MKKQELPLLAAAFLLPVLLALAACAVLGLAPFGSGSLAVYDAQAQYLSYYAFYQDLFFRGADFLYSTEKVLGGSVFGLFAYYLSSPLQLLMLLFPGEKLPLALDLLIVLKLGLCGLTMALTLRRRKLNGALILLCATAYALCGYNLSYGWCVMWLDTVLLLPLVILGLERLLREGKWLLYLVSLTLAIVSCFYTAFMLCIFTALYFVYLLCRDLPSLRALPWKRTGLFCACSLLAAGLSAVLLLPGLKGLSGGVQISFLGYIREYSYPVALYVLRHLLPGRSLEDYNRLVLPTLAALVLLAGLLSLSFLWGLFSKKGRAPLRWAAALIPLAALALWYFTAERFVMYNEMSLMLNRLPAKLSFGVTFYWEVLSGSPNVYVGQLTLLLALSGLLNPAIPARERKLNGLMLLVLVLSTLLYLPNLAWHGFEKNNLFNYRYSFVICFFLVLMAARALEALDSARPLDLLLPAALLLGCLGGTWLSHPVIIKPWMYLPTLLWLLLCAGLLLSRRTRRPVLLLAVHLAAMLFSVWLAFACETEDHVDAARFAALYREDRQSFQRLAQRDPELWRVRKARILLNYNDPMLLRYRGVTHYSSAEKQKTLDLMKAIGIEVRDEYWANGEQGSSRAADTLLGVRHTLADPLPGYLPEEDGFYRNPWALPWAYTAPAEVLDAPVWSDSPADNLNRIYQILSPGSQPLFTPAEASLRWLDEDTLELSLEVSGTDPLYLQLGQAAPGGLRLRCNGQPVPADLSLYSQVLRHLGSFAPGDRLVLELDYPEPPSREAPQPALFYESSPGLEQAHQALTADPVTLESPRDSRYEARVEIRPEAPVLVFSLPNEEGWQLTVDGAPAQSQDALGLFLAVRLEPGAHQVSLRYTPPGLRVGAAVSLVSLLATLGLGLVSLRRRRAASV